MMPLKLISSLKQSFNKIDGQGVKRATTVLVIEWLVSTREATIIGVSYCSRDGNSEREGHPSTSVCWHFPGRGYCLGEQNRFRHERPPVPFRIKWYTWIVYFQSVSVMSSLIIKISNLHKQVLWGESKQLLSVNIVKINICAHQIKTETITYLDM